MPVAQANWRFMDLTIQTEPKSAARPRQPQTAASPVLLVVGVLIAAAIFVADTITQLEIAVAVLWSY
jgi:hypothetical protein